MRIADWRERFAAFAARKQREAVAARLFPFDTDLDRHGEGLLSIGSPWSRALFGGDFYVSAAGTARPSASLVFVRSRDGNTVVADPSTLGGGESDKHLVYEGLSRVAADAVVTGAQTVRGSNIVLSVWHPEMVHLRAALGLPRHPVQVVATLRGVAFDQLMFNVPDLPAAVITSDLGYERMAAGLRERPWITPIVTRGPSELHDAFGRLRQLGIARASVIGGRTFAAELLDAGLIQDAYVTTSPRAGGQPNTPLSGRALDGEIVVRKHGTGPDAAVVFEHYRVASGGSVP